MLAQLGQIGRVEIGLGEERRGAGPACRFLRGPPPGAGCQPPAGSQPRTTGPPPAGKIARIMALRVEARGCCG